MLDLVFELAHLLGSTFQDLVGDTSCQVLVVIQQSKVQTRVVNFEWLVKHTEINFWDSMVRFLMFKNF